MTPIPLSLLPSTMEWRAPEEGEDGLGGEYGDPVTVEHVRFDEQRPRSTGGYSEQYQRFEGPSGTVFIDARNSRGEVPPVGALVSIDGGREMPVKAVKPFRGFCGRLHHTELEVG